MEYQRRQITNGQGQDKPIGHYALLVVKGSAALFAVQVVVWCILAWNDSPLAPVVFLSWFQVLAVWAGVMTWGVMQLR